MLTKKRIFVLASGSFSGAHFVDHCLSLGAEVVGINRSAETSEIFLPYMGNARKQNFRFYQKNINTDLESLKKLIADFDPHFVVDFAGQGMVAQSWNQPEQWYETNVLTKIKIHEHLRTLKNLEAYLRFSTPEVYGSTSGFITETSNLNPSTPYAVSHAAIDMSLMAYYRRYNFPVILTRTSNVYGPSQQLYRIIPRAILSAKLNKILTLDGGGTSIRNFIFIKDVSAALSQLLVNPKSVGQIFHISTEQYISIRGLVEEIAKLTNVPFAQFVKIGEERPGKDFAYQIDSSKIMNLTQWRPHVPLELGLKETVTWIDKNLSELKNCNWDYVHKH